MLEDPPLTVRTQRAGSPARLCAGALLLGRAGSACYALLIRNAVRTAANSLRLAGLTFG